MSWTKLATKEIFRNRWMWLTEDEVKTASGQHATYTVIHKQPFALIIPWDGERFVLVKQYRYFINFDSLEFPQGHYEHSSIAETARTELREETGYRAGKIQPIGSFFVASGAMDQECKVFLATDLTAGERELEASEEGLAIHSVTLAKMESLIQAGEIKDGPTISALHLFLASNLNK